MRCRKLSHGRACTCTCLLRKTESFKIEIVTAKMSKWIIYYDLIELTALLSANWYQQARYDLEFQMILEELENR